MISKELKELLVPIDEVIQRKKNPRKGDLETVKESLEVNGQYRPIVVNRRNNEILAGNHTWRAAKELGWQEIAVTYVDVDEEHAAKIVLIDNRANDKAGYNDELLLKILKDMEELDGTGYNNGDIAQILNDIEAKSTEGETDPDDIPDVEDTVAKTGDIYQLGNHRLICGDCTETATIEDLMDGQKANLYLTDPPYGVDYNEKKNDVAKNKNDGQNYNGVDRDIAGDSMTRDQLYNFLDDSFAAARTALKPGTPVYVFLADPPRLPFESALAKNKIDVKQILIWVKNSIVLGRQDYQWKHEPILYGWVNGAAHHWYGAFNKSTVIDNEKDIEKMTKEELLELARDMKEQIQTTIIRVKKPSNSDLHPTTKPVELLEKLINNSAEHNGIVLDSFGGSGSTLMAAERTGRRCYMSELDPHYIDVIIKRWEDYTGNQAIKVRGK